MNNIASFSPFESPRGLNIKILFPNTSRYLATLEQQSILRCDVKINGNMMYWFIYNNNFSPIKFTDRVEFSALLMVGITLAKTGVQNGFSQKLVCEVKTGGELFKPVKKIFFLILHWLCFAKQHQQKNTS